MTLPNFFIIGAAKAGTTALYEYLKQHPQIFMALVKEPKFFAFQNEALAFAGPGDMEAQRNVVTDLFAYENLFRGAGGARAIGEASVIYLYSEQACARIRHYVPDAKLIAVLRNPVERAFSNYLMNVRDGRETLEFADALAAEEKRIRENWEFIWHYTRAGFYFQQLRRYYDAFPSAQLHIILHEDLEQAPLRVTQETFAFLEVNPSFQPDVWVKHNVSTAVPKWRYRIPRRTLRSRPARWLKPYLPARAQRKMEQVLQQRDKPRPAMQPQVRRHLQALFREDILALQDLIRRDLSAWLAE
jgi:hypothetical protein